MIATSMLTLMLLLAMPPDDTCRQLEAGYAALLRGSFTVERHRSISVNGKPKGRDVSWLTYDNGTLIVDGVHREIQDKKLDMGDGATDPALNRRFSCRRVVAIGGDHFVLHAEDGAGELELMWDKERGIVIPVSWRTTRSARSWLRRIELETTATYGTFVWRD